MNNNSTRLNRIKECLADTTENSIVEVAQKMIPVFISDAASWLMKTYEKFKKGQSLKPKYNELQRYIEENNESIQIGMDKKEISIMWAMHKLGYSEEKIQEILVLANIAYLSKEKR